MKYILDNETLKKNLHLQVIARLMPDKLNIPKNWVPFNQIDKLVARNLIMDMPLAEVIKLFPKFSVNFINKLQDFKAVNNFRLANNWKHLRKNK